MYQEFLGLVSKLPVNLQFILLLVMTVLQTVYIFWAKSRKTPAEVFKFIEAAYARYEKSCSNIRDSQLRDQMDFCELKLEFVRSKISTMFRNRAGQASVEFSKKFCSDEGSKRSLSLQISLFREALVNALSAATIEIRRSCKQDDLLAMSDAEFKAHIQDKSKQYAIVITDYMTLIMNLDDAAVDIFSFMAEFQEAPWFHDAVEDMFVNMRCVKRRALERLTAASVDLNVELSSK